MIEICYGHPTCPHEIRNGENAGDCGKPRDGFCPEEFEDEAEYWEYVENRADDEGERKWEMRP